jgi:hypothetical protein
MASSILLASCRTETRMDADGFYKARVTRHTRVAAVKAKRGNPMVLESSRNGTVSDYEVYDIGKTVQHGKVIAAHQVLRHVPGIHGVTMPDNYVPQPEDRRINDAVADVQKAKDGLDAATQGIQARLDQDNVLRQRVEQLTAERDDLRQQVEKAFGTNAEKTMPPTGAPMTPAAQAGAAAADADALAAWGKRIQK